MGSFDLLKGRSDVAVGELQKQNRFSQVRASHTQHISRRLSCCVCCRVQERVLELETRVRTLLEEKERTEQGKSMSEKRLIELSTQLMRVLGLDASGPPDRELDRVLVKVSEVIQENAILKGKVVNMQAQMSDLEKEHRQHRDTVQQLMRQLQGVPDVAEEKRLLREARALLSAHFFSLLAFIQLRAVHRERRALRSEQPFHGRRSSRVHV